MENQKTHVEKMEMRLEKWGERLEEFVAKGNGVGTEARVDYRKRIDEVSSQYKVVRRKIDELEAAGDAEWWSFKSGLDSAWSELDTAYNKMTT